MQVCCWSIELNATRTHAIVKQACVGKPACAVAADERVFGTPCAGTLNLAVTVACQ